MMRIWTLLSVCVLHAGLVLSPLQADYVTGSVEWGGQQLSWHAKPQLVTTLSPDPVGADFPTYVAVHSTGGLGYSGVAALLISSAGGTSICTGSLLADGVSVLTAAHCLADSLGNSIATGIEAIFFPDGGGTYATNSSTYFIHPNYTGFTMDDHDIAIVRLDGLAPKTIDRYQLFDGGAVGSIFEIVGFGRRGQGDTGDTVDSGTRIRGFNVFDAPGGALLPFLGVEIANNILMYDFDNGNPANDAFGFWLGINDLGLGIFETSSAPGDSGGPSFVNGRIAAVTSFGLTFDGIDQAGNVLDTDVLPGLNSSFGEFAGSTSVAFNRGWIESLLVPEPATWVFLGLGLLLMLAARARSGARAGTLSSSTTNDRK